MESRWHLNVSDMGLSLVTPAELGVSGTGVWRCASLLIPIGGFTHLFQVRQTPSVGRRGRVDIQPDGKMNLVFGSPSGGRFPYGIGVEPDH